MEVEMKCMVCGGTYVSFTAGMEKNYTLVCGECNENLEGVFVGDQPVFYGLYTKEPALLAAHEKEHDSTLVHNWENVKRVDKWTVICGCPRDETRWNSAHN